MSAGETPPKRYRIGEVIEHTGLSRQTVHNYTMLGLIKEAARTRAGYRLYGEDVFAILARIKELKSTMTLAQIRELLDKERREAKAKEPDTDNPQ